MTAQITALGMRIIKKTGITHQLNSDGGERYWNIPFAGRYDGILFYWNIRSELLEAIEELGTIWLESISDELVYSETAQLQINFWFGFLNCAFENPDFSKNFKRIKPVARHNYDLHIGDSRYHITLSLLIRAKQISVEFYIYEDKSLFRHFLMFKKEFVDTLQDEIDWVDCRKASRVRVYRKCDIQDSSQSWQPLFDWMIEKVLQFKKLSETYGMVTGNKTEIKHNT